MTTPKKGTVMQLKKLSDEIVVDGQTYEVSIIIDPTRVEASIREWNKTYGEKTSGGIQIPLYLELCKVR